MKRAVIGAVMFLAAAAAFGQTATKYYVAHQGGYIGEATVTIKGTKVADASYAEWQGPGGWAEFNSPDGKSVVDGAIVRVPDPLANTAHPDPAIRGYMFYIYNVDGGLGLWSQYTPGKTGFARPSRQYERDFEGLMGNPIRAAAYAKAAREDTLVNVTIDGLVVTVGKPASQTVHYGHMNKADPRSTYMSLNASSIGYRYNYKATIDFFKKNPTADYSSAVIKPMKLSVVEDRSVDANAAASEYTAASDGVYVVADAVSGATYSDFQHYALELQAAYKMALAERAVKFKK
ncbi:MAG TPA: hypothetical protein P5298_01580 [Spirochaetia bacterium]|nr:hypothetical protein [Spirochaetaceae bacterium]HPE88293.1 hypothetical protein [Spirochaetales bacterium]HRW23084.1 hypothetical protein [Spirochaetia bacterium]